MGERIQEFQRDRIPYSVFLIPYSLFRIPYSVFLIPYSLFRIPYSVFSILHPGPFRAGLTFSVGVG
jgi:hypothetical protein